MKKKILFLMTLLAVSLLALAEMTVYVYKKDGTKVPYVASTVDSIGFVNVHTITFNSNGGTGSMDVIRVKEDESIALPANGFAYARAEFAGWNTAIDGSGIAYTDQSTIIPTANMTLYAQWEVPTTGTENGHEWVDLGLPSGTKWATMNVGADSPEDYGDYFAWGETEPKDYYDWSTYKWCKGSAYNQTKYCTLSTSGTVDNKTILDLSDDAACVNWGTSWRMPSDEELTELKGNCTWTWTTQNGVKGYKVTSEVNRNSIFLPAAGCHDASGLIDEGSYGYYWSSSLYLSSSNDAYFLDFTSYIVSSRYNARGYGRSVRPVLADVHTITFNANGGEGIMDVFYVKDDESVTLPANTFTNGLSTFVGWNTAANGSGTAYADNGTVKPTANITLYAQWEVPKDTGIVDGDTGIADGDTGIADGYEWVDLGLPSGTKWATMNVGADSPEDYGDYFAWGEITPKSSYTSSDYSYSSDPTYTLPLDRDAAYTNWGTSWRMPTRAEQKELSNTSYTIWTWTTQNGVKGYKVTSKTNGNSIFLPAAGYRYGSDLCNAGSRSYYWSSSLHTKDSYYAYYLDFGSDLVSSCSSRRYDGQSVRPVLRE